MIWNNLMDPARLPPWILSRMECFAYAANGQRQHDQHILRNFFFIILTQIYVEQI